jgi:hypothetical protein
MGGRQSPKEKEMTEHLKTKIKEEDGKVHISRSQDIQAILDFNKEKQIAGTKAHSEMRHVGQIPFVVVEMWLTESGLKLGSQEFAQYVKKKLMSGDFSKLIVHGY